MKPAFWDTSALVPLCVRQQPAPAMRRLAEQHDIVVWWATPVEMRSAFQRLLRMGQLTTAEAFLTSYPLKAADALQLAAARVWCSGDPGSLVFVSGDVQLLDAARQVGFQIAEI